MLMICSLSQIQTLQFYGQLQVNEHSIDEDRFLLLGMSETAKVCIVCHCYRESDTVLRIISARQATRKEEQRYVRGI